MEQEPLQDIIKYVIYRHGAPLSPKAVELIIKKEKLWLMPSTGQSPKNGQVSARVNNHPKLFYKENGLIHLVEEQQEKRLLRITFNEKRWELPSGHPWRKEDQSNTDVAFENQFGFGGEEWLFNPRYTLDGYQYGYIRGVYELPLLEWLSEAYLFTIDPKTKDRLLVAILKNVELLDPENLDKKVKKLFEGYQEDQRGELIAVGADHRHIDLSAFYPLLRFRREEAIIFDEPLLVNELKIGQKYNRFKPYRVEGDLEDFLRKAAAPKPTSFKVGKRKMALDGHIRRGSAYTVEIASLHNEINEALEKFLAPEYSVKGGNLSIETTTFGQHIADFLLKKKNGKYTLIEIKTSGNARYNIREALAQLLDYSNWSTDLDIDELIIISPSPLSGELTQYFKRLTGSVKLKLDYWQYRKGLPVRESFSNSKHKSGIR